MVETPYWTPERIIGYPGIADLDVSPDGREVLYAIGESLMTDDENRFVFHLYRVAVGQVPLRLTFGVAANTMPRWSPDGHTIAFLSDRAGAANIYLMQSAGGEAWPLTAMEKGVQSYAWSPDGSQIAFRAVPPDDEARQAAKKAKDDVIHWDADYEYAQLWTVPAVAGGQPRPEPRQLTREPRQVTAMDWAGDPAGGGPALVYTHAASPVDNDWATSRLALLPLAEGATPRDLGAAPTWGPPCLVQGGRVALVHGADADWVADSRVTLHSLADGQARPLAATPDAAPYPVAWTSDGHGLYAVEADGCSSTLMLIPTDPSSTEEAAPRVLASGSGYIWTWNLRANHSDTLAFVWEDLDQPPRICLWPAGAEHWQEIAWPCQGWPAGNADDDAPLPTSQVVHWPAPDGTEIEGILTLPVGYAPGRRYHTMVIVHGGPTDVYHRSYVGGISQYPVAAFAEAGYAVLRANPRGSGGYGVAFRRANRRDWGGGDYADIMSGVDHLIAQGIADPERLGIMGWSYGGFMTSWAITQTKRFRAASVGAGVTNLMSMVGTSDIPDFVPCYFESEYWQDPAVYAAHSAMFQIGGVTTPTLIQHGEADVRVPLSQGKELYVALKRQGVPVEMDIYPRQGHGASEPRAICDVMRRNLAWFDRWLGAPAAE